MGFGQLVTASDAILRQKHTKYKLQTFQIEQRTKFSQCTVMLVKIAVTEKLQLISVLYLQNNVTTNKPYLQLVLLLATVLFLLAFHYCFATFSFQLPYCSFSYCFTTLGFYIFCKFLVLAIFNYCLVPSFCSFYLLATVKYKNYYTNTIQYC